MQGDGEIMIKCNPREMNPFCSRLSEKARNEFCRNCSLMQAKRGECLPTSGRLHAIGIVQTGALAIDVPTETGGAFSTFVAYRGDVLNITKLARDNSSYDATFNDTHSAFAVVDSSVGIVPAEAVLDILEKDPQTCLILLEEALSRIQVIVETLEASKTSDSLVQVRRLIDALDSAGIGSANVTHETIGKILGMNRVTVTRAMAKILKEDTAHDSKQ